MPRWVDKPTARGLVEAFAAALPPAFNGCAMCALGDAAFEPDSLVHTFEGGVVRIDRFAVAPGHLLVVAREHEERVEALPWPRYCALQRAAWEGARAVAAWSAPRRVWIASLGNADPLRMSSPHVHLHVIPVVVSGEDARPARVLTWSNGVTYYDDRSELAALAASLRAAWPDDTTADTTAGEAPPR